MKRDAIADSKTKSDEQVEDAALPTRSFKAVAEEPWIPSSFAQTSLPRSATRTPQLQHGVFGPPPPIPPPLQTQTSQQRAPKLPASPHAQSPAEGGSKKRTPCSFYLKTGNCAFGSECKFEHPLDQPQTQYNSLGLPLRPGEPDCAYYVRNLHCGYGASCKFNHNEPVYSYMPVPLVDPSGMPMPHAGMPVYNQISSPQTAVIMPGFPMAHHLMPAPRHQLPLAVSAGAMPLAPGLAPPQMVTQFLGPRLPGPAPGLLPPLATPMMLPHSQMLAAQHQMQSSMFPGFAPALIAPQVAQSLPGAQRPPQSPQAGRLDRQGSNVSQPVDFSNHSKSAPDARVRRRQRGKSGEGSSGGRLARSFSAGERSGGGRHERAPHDGGRAPRGGVRQPESSSGDSGTPDLGRLNLDESPDSHPARPPEGGS